MIPRTGIVLLSRKNPYCPSCVSLRTKLEKLQKQGDIDEFVVLDVADVARKNNAPIILRSAIPVLYKDGKEILTGDSSKYTLSFIKQRLGV